MFSYKLTNILLYSLGIHPTIITIIIVILAFAFIASIIFVCNKITNKVSKDNSNPVGIAKTAINGYSYMNEHSVSNRMTKSMKVEVLNKDLEPFGFAYYPKQDIFYSIMDGWQRDCGYCELYDEASATLSMIIDCEPIRFEYGGRKWLIEFWKGQYGMTTGCEIGLYATDGPNLNIPGIFDGTFYYSANDADHIQMFFSLQKNGSVLFTRSERHWWLTGFRLGEFTEPSELSMNIQLTFKYKDMCNAFVDGLLEAGYSTNDITTYNNTVKLIFDKPHSPQPLTRSSLIESFMQTNNHRNCEAYQFATKNLTNTLDKLDYVKLEAPKMYRKIINVGSTKELFGGYKTIKKFIDHKETNMK